MKTKFPIIGTHRAALVAFTALALVCRAEEPRPNLPAEAAKTFRLAWHDEFDGDRVDEAKWNFRTGPAWWSTQQKENISVSGGVMRIALKKEDAQKMNYTAGGLISKPQFRYGYYEARFRCPPGRGWHTSFWLMNTQRAEQEIDICENDSINVHRYSVNTHRYHPKHTSVGFKIVETPDLSADFHTWGCEFTPAKVTYYFEGKEVASFPVDMMKHNDHSIWLTSLAASLGGTKNVDDEKLPAAAEYDYVRFFEPLAPYEIPPPKPTGPDFNAMIQPVPLTAKFSDTNFNIWCGSAIQSEDGKCHLFYSRWPRALGHVAWVTHSEIAHAVADTPFGPFKHVDVVLPARGKEFWDGLCTHNPTVIRANGKYYLYYMGNTGDGIVQHPLNWIHRNNQRIGVAVADSPNGPWQRFDKPVLDASADTNAWDALMVSNPSVCQRPDGGFLMVYKAVAKKTKGPFGGPVSHMVAMSDSPTGPFVKKPDLIFGKTGVAFAAEDPFIWFDADRYRAIVKDNSGNFTGRGYSLALFESADGIDWKQSPHVLVTTPEITWADGRKQKLAALERPQLYFENGKPVALFCAAADHNNRDGSFNIQIPLKGQP